jgi:transcription termination factor Rho
MAESKTPRPRRTQRSNSKSTSGDGTSQSTSAASPSSTSGSALESPATERPSPQAPGQHAGERRGGSTNSDEQLDAETQARYEQAKKSELSIRDLQDMELPQLYALAEAEGVKDYRSLKRRELMFAILQKSITKQGLMYGEGVLEILPDNFGFLRSPEYSYLPCPDDIYVSPSQIRRFGLKVGHVVQGTIRPPKESERYFALLRVDAVNGYAPDALNDANSFEDLTPLHPYERFVLETPQQPKNIEMRIVDLVTPLGRGQRGLIVAPPRTGKTVLLQKMANSIITNYPDAKVIVLLIDERPEEVTDFKNNTPDEVEVVASTFDEKSDRHVQVCDLVIEKARRMVEFGEHVVILMDSITRMARAYNTEMPHSGKILSGGLDANALQRPKKFFGSARAIDKGGSLTILATALVDTGSKMDDIIFEEFKGTGNSELHLDRRLVEKRVWPAIDIAASGTRREELLLDPKELELVYKLRKVLADMNIVEAMELLKSRLNRAQSNAEFLLTMNLD